MRISTLIIAFVFCYLPFYSQEIEVIKGSVDMGTVERGHDRLVESSFANKTMKRLTLLRVEGDKAYDVRTDFREVMPSEEMRIRIKFNPAAEGKYTDVIHFYFSTITYELTVSSDVKYIDNTDHTPCPDFEDPMDEGESDWTAYFKVMDRYTREIIPEAKIKLEGKSGHVIELEADKNGEVSAKVPIDFYYISTYKKGFSSFNQENYINRRNADHILTMIPGEGNSVFVLNKSDRGQGEKKEEEASTPVEEEPEEEAEEVILETPLADTSDFSIAEYKANNVVFLIDISTSMRQEHRMDLLKSAMIELAAMLRPDDIISIVTYASKTDVVISGMRADDNARIKEVIEALQAEGMTAGEAGLKQAYKECERYFINGGNNHVYLATDGAFNQEYDDMMERVVDAGSDEMHLTILAIKSNKWSDRRMIDLAEAGGGRHLKFESVEDQGALKQLIRQQSKR